MYIYVIMRRLINIRTTILGLLLLMAMVSKGQTPDLDVAGKFYVEHIPDSAKVYIDKAMLSPQNKEDAYAWQLRGFIYKDLYNKKERNDKTSRLRVEAMSSIRKSIILDSKENNYLSDNINVMKYLINTMHNDAGESLDPVDYETAISLFRQEQEYFKIIDPSAEAYNKREIEFAAALGSVYNSIIESSQDSVQKQKYVNLAKSIYSKIISIDPNNFNANYNMGILYYNQAVSLIKTELYDADMVLFQLVLDQSVTLFRESLPFMEKAYKLDPKREDALEGLRGIYVGLNDPETSDIYKQRLEMIKKNKKK